MKFVLFNVAIIAALFYLFNADRVDFRSLADQAYAAVDGVREKAGAVVETAKVAAPSKEPAAPEPEIVHAAPAEPLDPAVAKRRAVVLGTGAPEGGVDTEVLMTPEQRRRELFALAEDMELLYVRRLNR